MKEYKGCKVPTSLDKHIDELEMDYPNKTACGDIADTDMPCIGILCFECILHKRNRDHLTTYLREQNMNKEQTEALKRIESIRAELEQLERVVVHKEPELVLCLNDQGEWADRYGWKGKHEGMRKHGRVEIGLAEYDVILTDKSACDSNCIWLGYWNDGPI